MSRSSRRRGHTSVEIVQAFLIPIQRGARQAHNLLNHRVRDLLASKQTPTKGGFFIPLSVGRQRFLCAGVGRESINVLVQSFDLHRAPL